MSQRLKRIVFASVLALTVTACVTARTPTLETHPTLAECEKYQIIRYALGKKNATVKDVLNLIISTEDEIDETRVDLIRNLIGDTSLTIRQAKEHNTVLRAQCPTRVTVKSWEPGKIK